MVRTTTICLLFFLLFLSQFDPAVTKAFGQSLVVETQTPERKDLERNFSLPGTLEPLEESVLYAKVSGYLDAISVDIGDRVEAGQQLAALYIPEMAPEIVQSEAMYRRAVALLAQANAEATAAAANADAYSEKENATLASIRKTKVDADLKKIVYERFQGLKKDGAVTELEFDEAFGEYESAQAMLASAKAQLASAKADTISARAQVQVAESQIAVGKAEVHSAHAEVNRLKALASYATIRAPYKGIVTARYVHTGQLINEGSSSKATPIVRVVRDEKLRLQFDVPEKDTPLVKPGSPFIFTPDALPHRPFAGEVGRIAGELDPDSRTMLAEAIVDNEERVLNPGMFVRISVELEVRKGALTLPAKALVLKGEEVFVWTVEAGAAKRVAVEIGYDDAQTVEIASGLDENAQVVVSGQVSLIEGMTVKAVEAP